MATEPLTTQQRWDGHGVGVAGGHIPSVSVQLAGSGGREGACLTPTPPRACWLCARSLSRIRLCNPVHLACQAPLSMGFSRQEYWSGLPFPPPGDLPHPRDRTCVSCISRWILYHYATCEAWACYLLAQDTHVLCCQEVQGEDEPPVEDALPRQGAVVDIRLLHVLLQPEEPPGARVFSPGVLG